MIEHEAQQRLEHARNEQHQRDRPRVVTQLRQHAAARGERARAAGRPVTGSVRAVAGAGAALVIRARSGARTPRPCPRSRSPRPAQQAPAARGSVPRASAATGRSGGPRRARDWRRARSRPHAPALRTMSTARAAEADRVPPSARRATRGAGCRQAPRRVTRAPAWPPESLRTSCPAYSASPTRASSPPASRPRTAREVAHVLSDGQVLIHRGSLRLVAELRARRGAPRRRTEDRQRPGDMRLHPRDRADERRLAAAARPEQPGHLSLGKRRADAVQHLPAAAMNRQVVDSTPLIAATLVSA